MRRFAILFLLMATSAFAEVMTPLRVAVVHVTNAAAIPGSCTAGTSPDVLTDDEVHLYACSAGSYVEIPAVASGDITTDPAWAAKGDLIVGTANDSASILTVGANGKFLKADSGETTGLKWETLAGGGDALTSNALSQFAATTSAELAGVLSNETGTGLACFNTAPNIVNPFTIEDPTSHFKVQFDISSEAADRIYYTPGAAVDDTILTHTTSPRVGLNLDYTTAEAALSWPDSGTVYTSSWTAYSSTGGGGGTWPLKFWNQNGIGNFTGTTSGSRWTFSGNTTAGTAVVAVTGGISASTWFNKVAITTPATGSTLTIDDGFTLRATANATVSGTNTGDQTAVSGNAGTVTTADASGDTTTWPMLATSATGSLAPATDAGLTYNATTDVLGSVGGFDAGASGLFTSAVADGSSVTAMMYKPGVALSSNTDRFLHRFEDSAGNTYFTIKGDGSMEFGGYEAAGGYITISGTRGEGIGMYFIPKLSGSSSVTGKAWTATMGAVFGQSDDVTYTTDTMIGGRFYPSTIAARNHALITGGLFNLTVPGSGASTQTWMTGWYVSGFLPHGGTANRTITNIAAGYVESLHTSTLQKPNVANNYGLAYVEEQKNGTAINDGLFFANASTGYKAICVRDQTSCIGSDAAGQLDIFANGKVTGTLAVTSTISASNLSGSNTGDQTCATVSGCVPGAITTGDQLVFKTIDTSTGTDPVADTTTDTLTLTAGTGITVTGDSSTDTVTIAATGLTSKCDAWPVDSIFISISSTNPGTTLGCGTWIAFATGRVLVGIDSGDTTKDVAEETGGALTVASSAQTFTGTSSTVVVNHVHVQNINSATTGGTNGYGVDTSTSASSASGYSTANPTGGAASYTPAGTNAAGAATSVEQPYIAVYMWKRTA